MEKTLPLRLGIIGCGRIAQMRHLPNLQKIKGVEVVALADSNPEALATVAGQYKVLRCFADHRALLDDKNVDAVLVCTPPASHFNHARNVLDSGRHLYVESPLAISVSDCESLTELGKLSGKIATVGMNLRYHSLIQRARICIQDGLLGPVHAITSTFSTPSRGNRGDVFPAWRDPQTVDGSVFGESALQHFDCWRTLTGAEFTEIAVQRATVGGPVSIAAKMKGGGSDNSSLVVVGAVFSEYSGDNSEIRLLGRDGTITLSLYRYDGFSYCPAMEAQGSVGQHLRSMREGIQSFPQGISNLMQGGEYAITFRQQLQAFVAACKGGEPPLVSLADGKAAAVASLAAFQSMTGGSKVEIQP
jgi:myo-inositol 2-dehydrogenase/D-chiro-inositol 1-dehydrogenase